MKRILKGILKGVLVLVGVIVIGISLLSLWMSYSSPVNEAGREYRKEIRSYRNGEIESMDDVYERVEMLKKHYNSTTFHKVQGGDKTEVTLSDIETLFEKPDQVHEEINLSVAENVYQYKYDNITLNFHDRYSNIEEYVLEDFTGNLYDPQTLDQLFLELIPHNEGLSTETEDLISEKDLFSFIEESPTRETHQEGWVSRMPGPRYYFDTGDAEFSPKEYLLMQFEENADDTTELILMERRYDEEYTEKDSPEEISRKTEARKEFMELLDNEEETILVEDLMNAFGGIANISYDYRYGTLLLSWVIVEDDGGEEIKAEIPMTDSNRPVAMEKLSSLEVERMNFNSLYEDSRILSADEFIGSE